MKPSSSSTRYLRNHFGSISEEDIVRLERELGKDLPRQYRKFLLRENGGIPNEEGKERFKILFGIYDGSNNLALHWRETREELPDGILAIGESLNEDYIFLDINDGSVYLDGERIASGFDEFTRQNFISTESTASAAELINDRSFAELAARIDAGTLDIDAEAKFGKTLIQYSAWLGKDEAVKFLAERGANPQGCLHAMLESGFGHLQIIKCLLKHGADIHQVNSKEQRVFDVESPWTKHIIEQAGGHQLPTRAEST
ncbi:MAG: SMI1/KNR4 family protein [Verrucomicrobiales bacterium]|nr:SMI1/KNR4 family protein [Verrucomicrobiales bacterium]